MGSQICSCDRNEPHFSQNVFQYVFDEDNKELRIEHDTRIECSAPEIEKNLRDCEERLRKSQKLFKDQSTRSEPIILKSLTGYDTEVKCTFERPYVFLHDPTASRGKPYRIVNKLDSKSSQIIVRDEALQYFGVFLCYLADHPLLITDILLTGENNYGIHCLRMNINSIQQPIYIDDYVLCLDRVPLFVQPVKWQFMWTCLFEKAWLKVNGSISKTILKVDPEEVFRTFLSYPMRSYLLRETSNANDESVYTENRHLLRAYLHNLEESKGCIITTKKSPRHKIGISGRKYFYLIKCFDLDGKKMYYLRNPCFKGFDFRGRQAELSDNLIEKLMLITKGEKNPEGNFVLQEQEFLEQVQSFLIIHFEPNSSIISELALNLQEEKEAFVELEVPNNGSVSLCFHQSLPSKSENAFSPLSYLVISQTQSPNRVISDLKNSQACFGITDTYLLDNLYTHLKAGKYLIRLKKKRASNKITSIGKGKNKLVVAAPFPVTFKKDSSELKAKFQEFLLGEGRSQLPSIKAERITKNDFLHVGYWIGDLAIIYLQNISKSKAEIKVQAEFSQLKNLKCTTDNIQNSFVVIENIQNQRLIIFEKIDLAEETRLGRYAIQSF